MKILDKMTVFLEEKFAPVAMKIGSQRHLQSIRDGLLFTMPFIILGSIFLIIGNLPVPGYDELMNSIFGEVWKAKVNYAVRGTFDMLAIIASVGVAYSLASKYALDSLAVGLTSLSAFIIATPTVINFTPNGSGVSHEVAKALSLNYTSSRGLFVAIITALMVTEIYNAITKKDITIKMPDSVPPAVARSFSALIPAGASLLAVWVFRIFIEMTPFESVHNIVQVLLGKPVSMLAGSLWGIIIAIILIQLLWATGLHGSAIVIGLLRPVLLVLMDENRVAFQAGEALPNVISLPFYELWVIVGGAGATLGLAIILLFARSKQLKELGKLSIIPGLFNINEPLIFGTPIVMNPLLLIPWIIAPIVTAVISYYTMALNIVARPIGIAVPWTTPAVISGFLATGKLSGALLQVVLILISAAIYYPFIKIWDTQKCMEESESVETEKEAELNTI